MASIRICLEGSHKIMQQIVEPASKRLLPLGLIVESSMAVFRVGSRISCFRPGRQNIAFSGRVFGSGPTIFREPYILI